MKSLITTQQEKARAILLKYVRNDDLDQAYLCGLPSELKKDLNSLIASTVTAVLDGVREIMPLNDQKNYPLGSEYGMGWNEYRMGWNEYRAALLKSLEEMEGI